MFNLRKAFRAKQTACWYRRLDAVGIRISRDASSGGMPIESPLLGGYLEQLLDDGWLTETSDGGFLEWEGFYGSLSSAMAEMRSTDDLAGALQLPEETSAQIVLRSEGTLIDAGFSIIIAGWRYPDGIVRSARLEGAILQLDDVLERLTVEQWQLVQAIRAFSRRPDEERDDMSNRRAWGHIRSLALAAHANLDDFLTRSVVVTPERMLLALRRSAIVSDGPVVEIIPGFDGVPDVWLAAFDQNSTVLPRYDLSMPEGIIQVLITPQVRTVLESIKRMPGRRVAGARAEAILRNPMAALGEDAQEVLDPKQIEEVLAGAGVLFERFTPRVVWDAEGRLLRIGLLIEPEGEEGLQSSEIHWLSDEQVENFIERVERAIQAQHQLVAWNGHDLAIRGETPEHLHVLREALRAKHAQMEGIAYERVHDLGIYSERIAGIGQDTVLHVSAVGLDKEGDVWFPEQIPEFIAYTPEGRELPVRIPTDPENLDKLEKSAREAKSRGETDVQVPGTSDKLPVDEVLRLVGRLKVPMGEAGNPKSPDSGLEKPKDKERDSTPRQSSSTTLILLDNIDQVDYEEKRRIALSGERTAARVPACIRSGLSLLPHQREGVAWLQHLYGLRSDFQVRGAILADDMGLGKTFQLLAFMASLIEENPSIEPMLVVAPVSLLENWAEEADKFFVPGVLTLLTAYGDALAPLRVPRHLIDERLRNEDGLVRFLKPGWIGDARVVLTTYETLRDFEFSFAAEKWSVMVCDEAQRIKNPAAMVTRAAKKQQAGFRVACTGTPVENNLADIWCLFDYIQPGLLGALSDFTRRYRKPIEACTDQERQRVGELRARIQPQVLRRLKQDVAKDLPQKIVDEGCRRLPLSPFQRSLYAQTLEGYRASREGLGKSPFKNQLGVLHYLRLLCTDPQEFHQKGSQRDRLDVYRAKAPKMDWLLTQLKRIQRWNEKVIVFCEFREVQRLLQSCIEVELGYSAIIINGDTSASSRNVDSRQKRIRAFQEKPGFGVLILSPVAVGFGVNIQAANHVVHYMRTWNPAKEDQATDRAYRIGQTKDVHVYYPTVAADDFVTFDVKLDQLLTKKRELAGDMLNGSGDISGAEFDTMLNEQVGAAS